MNTHEIKKLKTHRIHMRRHRMNKRIN